MRLLFLLLAPIFLNAQTDSISGVLNRYAAVLSVDTCTGRIGVNDTAGFRAGEKILLIQMQGAAVSTDNNAGFGQINALNAAGQFEQCVLDSIAPGAFYLRNRLRHSYQISGKIQVVTLPDFSAAVVTDTLRPKFWDGATGGVLAFSVENTLTLHAPVLADGAGFRGGSPFVAPVNNCTWLIGESDYYYPAGNWRGAFKGEGIAAIDSVRTLGRGPLANGGGGGNDHNAGGGGGSHTGAGGVGGDNDEPATFGCDGYFPGLPGRALTPDSLRLFMGGGGGAGHANNNLTSAGGNGGGIILIEAGRIEGSGILISANGLPGSTANGDGGGGGGAGGTVWLRVSQTPDSLRITANGGAGGNTVNINQNRCFGPGGGGGGGIIRTNLAGITPPAGGAAGVITLSSNGCNGTGSGALAGNQGGIAPLPAGGAPAGQLALAPAILDGPENLSVCAGDDAVFAVQTNSGDWQYQWEMNDGSGWMPANGGAGISGFLSPELKIAATQPDQNGYRFRCAVRRAGCVEIISGEAQLTVAPLPVAGFEISLNGNTAFFENLSQNANAWWWDFGDGAGSAAESPEHTYAGEGAYIVTLYAISDCDTAVISRTLPLLLAPVAGFSAPDSVANCETVQVMFVNQSSANALGFVWYFPGGTPATSTEANPVVNYAASGIYPVTLIAVNTAGADTVVQAVKVNILGYPAADFSYALLGGGWVAFTNLSQNADSYTWYFGDSTAAVQSKDALHQYAQSGVFTVTLVVDNFCGTAVLQKTIEVILTGTKNPSPQNSIRAFPNPVSDQLWIESRVHFPGPVELQIFDQCGRLVWSRMLDAGHLWPVDLTTLEAGAYQLVLRSGKKTVQFMIIRQ